ncbi:MAG TPA: Holliday junction resolvase RuvX [Candidatus Peribacterales bacterium]|nr:Holliday junction resolvase RuvX [Candidatus Peribacterales bacterium]
MNYLALDLGRKHTGVAYADSKIRIAMPLETIHHIASEELIHALQPLILKREIGEIVVGMPYLMSGREGEEAERVHGVLTLLQDAYPTCTFSILDERETSRIAQGAHSTDNHAEAAVRILATYLDRKIPSGISE